MFFDGNSLFYRFYVIIFCFYFFRNPIVFFSDSKKNPTNVGVVTCIMVHQKTSIMKKTYLTLVVALAAFSARSQFLVEDINPGGNHSYPMEITPVGSAVYFTADNGSDGNELWMYDGSSTTLIDINPGVG